MRRCLFIMVALLLSSPGPYGQKPVAEDQKQGSIQVNWFPWDRRSFEVAAGMRRPVLLYLRSEDCRLCQIVERDVLGNEEVKQAIINRTVPVQVDAVLRPDLHARYLMSVVPTLAILLPNGEPIYEVGDAASLERAGGLFTNPIEFKDYLIGVTDYVTTRAQEIAQKAKEVAEFEAGRLAFTPGQPPLKQLDQLIAQVRDGFDFTHGGFGREWKGIEDDPYRLFRFLAMQEGEEVLGRAVVKTAETVLSSPMYDDLEGGFHHFATRRDWSAPALEKRLGVNASGLRLLVTASLLAPDNESLKRSVAKTADFMLSTLLLRPGVFAFSQLGTLGPDDVGGYFLANAEKRKTLRPPRLNKQIITSANAEAAVALLEAGALLGREDLEAAGLAVVDHLSSTLFERGRGFSHYLGPDDTPELQGLLVDQVEGIAALLAAYQVRGEAGDLKRAVNTFQFCEDNLQRPGGYFIDRVDDLAAVGMMRRPLVPYGMNGKLALAAYRLQALTGEVRYRQVGDAILGALSSAVPKMRGRDAAYVEAVLAARELPFRAVISAAPEDDGKDDLRRRTFLLPVAGAVSILSGEAGGRLPPGLVLPEDGAATGAYLCSGKDCRGPLATPDELAAIALALLAEEAPAP